MKGLYAQFSFSTENKSLDPDCDQRQPIQLLFYYSIYFIAGTGWWELPVVVGALGLNSAVLLQVLKDLTVRPLSLKLVFDNKKSHHGGGLSSCR